MRRCHWMFVKTGLVLAILSATSDRSGASETYRLAPSPNRDEISQVEITLQVGGDLRLAPAGAKQPTKMPMSVRANLTYDERRIADSQAERLAYRHYKTAEATLKIDKGGQTPSLSDTHRVIGVRVADRTATMFCPKSRLTRDELDLIEVPGNSLVIEDLLPKESVSIGSTWKANDDTLALVLDLEAVSFSEVQSTLIEVREGRAVVAMAGTVGGAVGGVGTEMEIKAKYTFDLKQQRIDWFALLIKEKRAIGHIGPGLDLVAKLIMKITPAAKSEELGDAALARLPDKVTPVLKALAYQAPKGEYRFAYDPRWFVTSEERDLIVLRLVDRGELVAQCNVSPIRSGSEKPVTLAQFQDDVQLALGKSFGQFEQATEYTDPRGTKVFRLVARGDASGLAIHWIYYLMVGPNGQRLSVAFTLESDVVEQFDNADRPFVANVHLGAPAPVEAAAKPSGKKS